MGDATVPIGPASTVDIWPTTWKRMYKTRSNGFIITPAKQNDRSEQPFFRVGDVISESGIYCVHHSEHRRPHEVTLLRTRFFLPAASVVIRSFSNC